ncbi:MAG: class C sortase [Firmicutes bacterium]|nr:class C sortase [Bacillota bacterium]
MKTKSKNKFSTIILISIIIVGIGLLLYPTVSNYWNSMHQTRAIASYVKTVNDMDDSNVEALWAQAVSYNRELGENGLKYSLTEDQVRAYEEQLATSETDVMAYVEIPKIRCRLAIYHGTDEAVLQVAAGHLEWSSLPVGGSSSHCVLSGHRGLPSAKLFTDIDRLEEGDIFMLHTLGKTLTYEVDQIRTVLPEELQDVEIEPGQDYCTLVTCTPYGVNTHRLLVRGHRVPNQTAMIGTDASRIDPMLVASILLVIILTAVLIWLLAGLRKSRRKEKIYGGDVKK